MTSEAAATAPDLDRRTIWAWSLMDFGNSSFAVLFASLFSVFYTQEIVKPAGAHPDLWWGLTIAASMLLVAFSSPFMGGISDHTGLRKRLLVIYTVFGSCAVLSLLAIQPGHGMSMVVVGSVLAAASNFAFEGSLVFYNAYLPEIAPSSHRGRVSALGFAVGYAGSLLALLLAWPILNAGAWGWLWVAIAAQWVIFSLPAFKRLPPDQPTSMGFVEAARAGVRQTRETLRHVWGVRDLRHFLLAFFVYMDGVITVVFFAARYATETLGFSTLEVLGMLAIVQITALAGALAMGKPTDLLGPKKTVQMLLFWWVGVALAAYFAEAKITFLVVAGLAGLGLGSIQAASRVFLTRLTPPGRESELFGFYALCGKTGSILGPVTFGVVTVLTNGNQRPAVLAVAVFYFVGLLLLKGVSDKQVTL